MDEPTFDAVFGTLNAITPRPEDDEIKAVALIVIGERADTIHWSDLIRAVLVGRMNAEASTLGIISAHTGTLVVRPLRQPVEVQSGQAEVVEQHWGQA